MNVRCRCNHVVNLEPAERRGTVRCPYCGRSYHVSRDADGRPKVCASGGVPPGAPLPFSSPELELEMPSEAAASRGTSSEDPPAPLAPPWHPGTRRTPAEQQRAEPASKDWWGYLVTAWAYPFRRNVRWAVGGWLLLYFALGAFLEYAGVFWVLMSFLMGAMLVMYEFMVIRQSALDGAATPTLPVWQSIEESALHPLELLLAALIGSGMAIFLVAPLVRIFIALPPWWPHVTRVGVPIASFLLPINLLAVAVADRPGAINPIFTFPAIFRIPGPYLVCAGSCFLCVWGGAQLVSLAADSLGAGFLTTWLGLALEVYLCTVAARVLGTMHYCYSERIGWVRAGA